jgi:atypical dual specificity phosphatase
MVHCSGGRGRTGTILAAYLIKNEKGDMMSAEQAIKKLRTIREGKSVQSKDQERILFSYEQYIINKNQTRKDNNNNTSNAVS